MRLSVNHFTVSCGTLIITDPYNGVSDNLPHNTIQNAKIGKWTDRSFEEPEFQDELYYVHENYRTPQLQWENCESSCGVNSGFLGVYDSDAFKSTSFSEADEFSDWGTTELTGELNSHIMQIGRNTEGEVCGVRHEMDTYYTCNNCSEIIEGPFYLCEQCPDYELCSGCFDGTKNLPKEQEPTSDSCPETTGHVGSHTFIKCPESKKTL